MKATLEFDMIEEREQFNDAVNGTAYSSVVDELFKWLRNLDKYSDRETVLIEEVEDKLRELLRDENLI